MPPRGERCCRADATLIRADAPLAAAKPRCHYGGYFTAPHTRRHAADSL